MKALLLLLVAVVCVGCVTIINQAPNATTQPTVEVVPVEPALSGPVAYYTFDGDFNDQVGTNHLIDNGVMISALRRHGTGSMQLGNGQYAIIPKTMSRLSGPITINLWMNVSRLNGTYSQIVVQDWSDAQRNFAVWIARDAYELSVNLGDGNEDQDATFSAPFKPNEWTMVTVVRDGRDQKLFIDGKLSSHQQGHTIGGATDNQRAFGIFLTHEDSFFRGNLDDVGFWDRALTDDEVEQLYVGKPLD